MEKGLVSIVTPVYNGAKYVCETIDSVLRQTYANWEMIVVDDGSKDNSAEIINEYVRRDKRIVLLRQANGGSASARNIIRKSKFPPNPERSVQFSGKRTKRSVQKKGCTQHL